MEKMIYPNWNIQEFAGYSPKTTLFNDFKVAEIIGGVLAIKDTYKRVKEKWKNDIVYVAELYLVLNHKIWAYYYLHQATGDDRYDELARLYNDLWNDYGQFVDEELMPEMSDADKQYFWNVTD